MKEPEEKESSFYEIYTDKPHSSSLNLMQLIKSENKILNHTRGAIISKELSYASVITSTSCVGKLLENINKNHLKNHFGVKTIHKIGNNEAVGFDYKLELFESFSAFIA